ncbi:relaxase/mobilization nuclease domain-containing protein [Flagellimonas pacifica]|uniref:Relaxase/Mobilisation nuclease domain-containing protein n=1 Tax=Flagellimonas pacifica TaxID=1247520 RepID=A0A285MXA1_9FLAO|nr:relaxase/mobilization nuclease domain-containing protein [Allomuricauda parva]SNZ01313.1 Relaxase/Mobilisation nuclease domain-containing protein [Allomuricauda parva]
MIARILYRESVHGILNYVLHKEGAKILGFSNTSPEMESHPELLKHALHFMGNRHGTKKRYTHITINLPHGEFLSDGNFHKLATEYMDHMGYGEQPFVVVRHDDTKHEHVHIVTTTVKDDNTLVNLSHDYNRNIATQKHLEKEYGLQPSPETMEQRELAVHRLPEIQPLPDDSNGVKFYIQDILNTVLQRYKVRSFEELSQLVKPYHILISHKTNENGRVGVSYGIEVDNGYRSRFINGYVVHPKFSGPKMDSLFKRNSKSKLVPMHKKRLEKQLLTTKKLFKNISPEDMPSVLREYQKMDFQILYNKKEGIEGFMIHDKSGYVFQGSEISPDTESELVLAKNSNGPTKIDLDSDQFTLEIRKMIKEALYKQYLNSYKKNVLLSEYVLKKNGTEVWPEIQSTEGFTFLSNYMPENSNAILSRAVQREFEFTRNAIHATETKKELNVLEDKVELIKKVLDTSVFDLTERDGILFELVQSVGAKYANQNLSYINSNLYAVPLALDRMRLPNETTPYISTGFINENEKMLKCLLDVEEDGEKTIRANALFLPLIFPKLYEAMIPRYRQKFEELSLGAYLKTAQRFHVPFEKSALDYIKLFNAKGFYFESREGEIHLFSIYDKFNKGLLLSKNTQAYLKSIKNLTDVFQNQYEKINALKQQGRDRLQNLWVSYLIEKQLYDKAAFMIVYDGIRPYLSLDVMEYHMNNGLKSKILDLSKRKINAQHLSLLRKSVYAFSALMGKSSVKDEEVFNGFKDELTDYSRYKNVFI